MGVYFTLQVVVLYTSKSYTTKRKTYIIHIFEMFDYESSLVVVRLSYVQLD